eukprot:180191-Rhodomonas_salina.3
MMTRRGKGKRCRPGFAEPEDSPSERWRPEELRKAFGLNERMRGGGATKGCASASVGVRRS